MKLNMTIKNIKAIDELTVSLPVDKGLYAITGQNGSGKSTIITCALSAYFNMNMNEYFGKTPDDAEILFELNGARKEWRKDNGRWRPFFHNQFKLSGFYEGSIIFGSKIRQSRSIFAKTYTLLSLEGLGLLGILMNSCCANV